MTHEWTDALTGERHTCPSVYTDNLLRYLGKGIGNALTAKQLLLLIGVALTPTNERHLRKAVSYLRFMSIPVVSCRSTQGGYYIAASREEITGHTSEIRKIAGSMLTEASRLEAMAV